MAIATAIKTALGGQSMIRQMFEEGGRLKKQHGADKVFDFSLGNPDLEPPPEFDEALLRFAKEKTPGSHGYMPNAGFPDAREKIAKKVSREHGVDCNGGHIVMSVGAGGALNSVLKAILNPGDEVVVPAPYFVEYRAYCGNYGGTVVEAKTKADFSLDVEAVREKLSPKTAAVLINTPNNPTGRVYPAEDLAALAEALTAHGKQTGRYPVLISDEPYHELVYGGKAAPPLLCTYPDSVVVTSFSKSLSLPGERIGYVAANPAMSDIDDFMAAVTYTTRVLGFVNAPALMQRIVAELTDVSVNINIYDQRRLAFKKALDEAGIEYSEPEGAFYIWAKVPPRAHSSGPATDADFSAHLKKFLILGVPGSGFAGPGWLRFAYCVDEKIIAASGEAFKQAMAEW
jgi:aspartate aminotransferase